MSRFSELIEELYATYPNDWWLTWYRLLPEVDDVGIFASKFVAYDQALNSLDDSSWMRLKEKTKHIFVQDYARRGKQPFFDRVNEAFAYSFLKRLGCSRIEFVQELANRRTPDLCFEIGGVSGLCEVKTINLSEDELARSSEEEPVIYSSEVYEELQPEFFNKLKSDIENALAQFDSASRRRIVFFVIHFDDFTEMYFQKYRQQIIRFIQTHYPLLEFYFQIGIDGGKNIHYEPERA